MTAEAVLSVQSIAVPMADRQGQTLVVVALVLVAGCNGVALGSDAADSPTPTLTPVPVPESETPPSAPPVAGSLPPGVSENGLLTVPQLLSAHEAFVDNRSYRWRASFRVWGDGTDEYGRNFTRVATIGRDAYLIRQINQIPRDNQSLYVTDGTGYLRSGTGAGARFDRVADPLSHLQYAFAGDAIERYLRGISFNVTAIERDGETLYRLHSSPGLIPPAVQQSERGVHDYVATAYVTPDGFVKTLVVRYVRRPRGQTQYVSFRFDYTDLSSTAVDEPAWLSDFPNETTPGITNATATPPPGTATPATATPANGTATSGNGTDAATRTP